MPEDPYDIVIRGRAALKTRRDELVKWVAEERRGKPFSVPSEATLADYRRDVDRLMSEGQPWEAAANTTKVKTWLKRKSALLTISALEIEQLLKAQDKLQRLKLPAMVCAVTGCRPSEITKGIELWVKKGILLAKIEGKKTGAYSGQPWRAMSWNLKDAPPVVCDLAKMVLDAGGHLTVDYSYRPNPNPAKAFSGAMRQAATRAFPGHAVTLTPYSMRHALASDMKASDLTPQEISKALGHQVVATQSTYGSRQQGHGGMAPTQVDAAIKDIRGKPSVPPNKAEKITAPEKAVAPK